MYINKVTIKNIRSIKQFDLSFEDGKQSGWHVLIGDNGAGKSSIVRSITLCLLGEDNAKALSLSEDFNAWVNQHETTGTIDVIFTRNSEFDKPTYSEPTSTSSLTISKESNSNHIGVSGKLSQTNALWGQYSLSGWFFAAYGPLRRLRGGTDNFSHLVNSRSRLGATLSVFRDDFALTQLTNWLKDLALDAPKKVKQKKILNGVIDFINRSELLPDGARLLNDIDSEGIKLIDANGYKVSLNEMSDGYKSILSVTLDIIRNLIDVYGVDKVFSKEGATIGLPGVVLVDEIDAHLHPTWQTRIGDWFTNFFPKIQFIVTTHSPLICRACENGTIWSLAAPGSDLQSGEITGVDKSRLIYGNVTDAYSTEAFGSDVGRSEDGVKKLERLAELDTKDLFGKLSKNEIEELNILRQTFVTYDSHKD